MGRLSFSILIIVWLTAVAFVGFKVKAASNLGELPTILVPEPADEPVDVPPYLYYPDGVR
jgi:hypothetical protein